MSQLFHDLGVSKITYLDVGAHHPSYLSNTYLFYNRGCYGVCIEPDPTLFMKFLHDRPRDINLNCGVGPTEGIADFFILSTPGLNTFSAQEAAKYTASGSYSVHHKMKIEIQLINHIIASNFSSCPNLVSIDIEGWDLAVLRSLDFHKYRPEVFCIETLSFTEDNSERKLTEIIDFMHQNDYITYADTYINTIFVDRKSWIDRA